ncbi:growth hormone-regulated TBC protein 1 [Selaginella moellendorffii]|nr:growth hormone-regulated TBC protein 1 [Selaginella moellendorffii]|eukprot:XP_002979169.2 growth hormone-regulated TBC protein 1 [Selaginella moellendorffii]
MGSSRMVWMTRKVAILDMYAFPLEVPLEDAALLNDLKKRVKEQHRQWLSIEASKGEDWYVDRFARNTPFLDHFAAYAKSKQLKGMIRKGIPPALRPKVWLASSGAAKKRSTAPRSYYNDLIEAVENRVTPATRQIDQDLPRTFPTHPWLDSKEGQQSLRRILVAYSFRDSRVGYCQGMNFITALLLLAMRSEEDAFWMLAVLLEDVLHSDTYSDNLYGCHIEQRVFKDLMRQRSPRLAAHFHDIGFDVSLVTTEWFLCLFSKSLPSETTMRIWDVLFNEGASIIFTVALSLFQTREDHLLCARNVGEALRILHDATPRLYNPDTVLKAAFEGLGMMTSYTIAKHREKQGVVVAAELQQKLRQSTTTCDIGSRLCGATVL